MATVHLSCEEATTTGLLPNVCIRCGRPATTRTWRTFSTGTDGTHVPPPPEPGTGCFLFVLWPIVMFANLAVWLSSRSMRVFAPYCAEHAKQGWFTDDPVSADEITSRGITLSGVADAFVLALLDLRRGPSLSR